MTAEVIRFLIPVGLGALAYFAATLAARFISPIPRHVYFGRLIFMALFVLLIWVLYFPVTSVGFSGSPERYYELGGATRGMGTFYGMHTLWVWCILALVTRPKNRHEIAT